MTQMESPTQLPVLLEPTTTTPMRVRFVQLVSNLLIKGRARPLTPISLSTCSSPFPLPLLGHYCSSKTTVPTACGSGDYSFAGSTSSGDCTSCPARYACPAMDMPPVACEAGWYSTASMTQCKKCEPGYFCADTNAAVAVTGKYYTEAGATYKTKVPPGYAFVSTSEQPVKCSEGTWW